MQTILRRIARFFTSRKHAIRTISLDQFLDEWRAANFRAD